MTNVIQSVLHETVSNWRCDSSPKLCVGKLNCECHPIRCYHIGPLLVLEVNNTKIKLSEYVLGIQLSIGFIQLVHHGAISWWRCDSHQDQIQGMLCLEEFENWCLISLWILPRLKWIVKCSYSIETWGFYATGQDFFQDSSLGFIPGSSIFGCVSLLWGLSP